MPYQLVVVKGRSANQALRIPSDGVTTVGRQQGCQIRIVSSQVSRKHCELFEKKGHLLVKDLGSSNGTLVNGKKIEGQQVVELGSILTIGSVIFRVETAATGAAGAAPPPPKASDTAVAQPVNSPGADDQDYEIEADSETRVSVAPEGAGSPGQSGIPEAKIVADEDNLAPVLNEDDVAGFLLEIDEDDKR